MKKFLLLISFVMLASVAGAQSLPTYVNAERVTPYAQTDMCLHNAMPVAVDMAGGGSSSAAASLAGVPLVRFQSYLNVGAVFQEKSEARLLTSVSEHVSAGVFMPVSRPDSVA